MLAFINNVVMCFSEAEAREVRKVIIKDRIQRIKPSMLVYVFRMLFYNFYGKFRLISCPQWGLKEDVLPDCCKDMMAIRRAVSMLVSLGDCLFSRFGGISSAVATELYNLEFDEHVWVSGGKGLLAVHKWVKSVQIRALQDIAVEDEHQFVRIWCTTLHEEWGDQAKLWSRALRIREDRDIGWVCDESAQVWSTNAWSVRERIKKGIEELGDLVVEEDEAWWTRHKSRDAEVVGFIEAPASAGQCTIVLQNHTAEHTKTASESPNTRMEDIVVPQNSLDLPSKHLIETEAMIYDNDTDLRGGGMDPSSSVITPSQVMKSAHICDFQSSEGNSFGDISYTQIAAVEVVTVQGTVTLSPLTLEESEKMDGGVTKFAQETNANSVNMQPMLLPENSTAGGELDGTSTEGARESILLELWERLEMDSRMSTLPTKGKGEPADYVVFFECRDYPKWQRDAITIPYQTIRNLKSVKTKLDENMVDFLATFVYLQQPKNIMKATMVVSSLAGSVLEKWNLAKVTNGQRRDWAKKYLVSHRRLEHTKKIMEIVFPYRARNHWSLFIFQRNKVFHLDSCKGIHDPSTQERDFVDFVYTAWTDLLGVKVPDPKELKVEDVEVRQQVGAIVCGYAVYQNLRIWMEVCTTLQCYSRFLVICGII